jgi:hypothetical protein
MLCAGLETERMDGTRANDHPGSMSAFAKTGYAVACGRGSANNGREQVQQRFGVSASFNTRFLAAR